MSLFLFLIMSLVFGSSVQALPCRAPIDLQVKQQNIPILLYHHISVLPAHASKSLRRWTLSPETFDDQMDWVKTHGFHTITMDQLFEHMTHGLSLPPNPIVISFDDGLKDHYERAYPELKKLHFVATFFIIGLFF